jgi:hypothetical protein
MLGQGQGLFGRAAESEARRSLIVTAVALERFRNRHGTYPKSLEALVGEFLKSPPVDFMDAQPLRYRLTDDGHFVLYSVGLDGIDDGGKMPRPRRRGMADEVRYELGIRQGTDLVWPRPASAAEAQAQVEADKRPALHE